MIYGVVVQIGRHRLCFALDWHCFGLVGLIVYWLLIA